MNHWVLSYRGFEPAAEGLRETLCTLGNGRFATRGAFINAEADGVHYPGTYLAGGYNRLESDVSGRTVENEDLVNWPNWLPIGIAIEDGHWLEPSTDTITDHSLSLHLREGVLRREITLADGEGRAVRIEESRLVSMAQPVLAAVLLTITPVDWSGRLRLRSFIDGRVANAGVPRYRALAGHHVAVSACDHPGDGVARLDCHTVRSGIAATFAARTTIVDGPEHRATPWEEPDRVGTEFELKVERGAALRVEKIVAFVTSRDAAIASPQIAATEAVEDAPRFEVLLAAHSAAWAALWDDFDIATEDGSTEAQRVLRLHLFHLLQTLSPHTAELDVGAPARGWHGEAYRGHVFWDEIFIFRVLNLRAPRLTRELLRYRYRRLPAARRLARMAGLPGAMYPWQSGSDGREETQTLHLNPRSGRWLTDATHRQRHVGLAIAYNIWSYFRATNDLDFMIEAGTEMMVEIARLFSSLASWDEANERFRIRGVMGPDEFHTDYPGGDHDSPAGIDDNAYTNVLCAFVLTRTVDALANLPPGRRKRLCAQLSIDPDEIVRWQELSERLTVPFMSNGLLAQFAGYEDLSEVDWEAYRSKYGDIHRMDRILEAEGKNANDYKVSKQADVLMLPFLFSAESLREIFEQLGYVFDPASIPALVEYYDARTSHGSTLSTIVHAWVVARTDRAKSWSLFMEALRADVGDVQGGTTREGIHLGAMCGTIDMVQNGYLGCEVRGDALLVDPAIPDALSRIRTRLRYRGQDVAIDATHETVTLTAGGGTGGSISVAYRGRRRLLPPEGSTTFRLVRPHGERTPLSGSDPQEEEQAAD